MELIGLDSALAWDDKLPATVSVGDAMIDPRVVWYAALLHDLKRVNGKTHPQDAAEVLRKEGYQVLMQPVAMHHDPAVWQPDEPLSEAEILYLADKLVQEDRRISLEERFAKSREKCTTPEALTAHEARLAAARGIAGKLRSAGREKDIL